LAKIVLGGSADRLPQCSAQHAESAVSTLTSTALFLARCSRKITNKFMTAVRQFTNDDVGGFWTWLPLDSTIIESAAKTYTTLPDTVFLRSADCLHLVTAMHHGFTDIYTYDIRQTDAAVALGLKPLKA
jgi:predicted nucleic acid-binding protein